MANSLKWSDWYSSFQNALMDAGYDSLYDTPVFDFIGSQDDASARVDKAISRLYDQGLSPEEVVAELEDRDGFIRKYNIGV